MPPKTKAHTEVKNRRKKVAALYLNKVDQADIADKLSISQATVSRDIKALAEEWHNEAMLDINTHISRELAELERMELETAAMYQTAKREDKPSSKREAISWMETRLKIKDRRAKLLGLDQPQKLDLKAEHSGQIVVNLTRKSFRKEDNV